MSDQPSTQRIEEICFGLGVTAQTGPEGKRPHPPGTKSLKFTIERNGCRAGIAYIDPSEPDPRAKIHELLSRQHCNYGVIEIWDGYPSEMPPLDYISAR